MVVWCLTSPPPLWGWCPRPCTRLTNPPFPVSLLFISTLTGQIFSLTDLSWDYKFRVNSGRDIFIKPRSFVVARHEHCRFNYLKSRFTAIFGGLQQWQQWGQGALSHLWNSFDTFNCTHWRFRNRDAVLLYLFPVSRFRFCLPRLSFRLCPGIFGKSLRLPGLDTTETDVLLFLEVMLSLGYKWRMICLIWIGIFYSN